MANLTITRCRPVEVIEQFTGPIAEAVSEGNYVRLSTTTGFIELGNATDAAESRSGGLAINGGVAREAVTFVKKGLLDVGNALSALAYDADVYLSDTDGKLADAAGTVSKVVGTVVAGYGSTTPDKLLRVNF